MLTRVVRPVVTTTTHQATHGVATLPGRVVLLTIMSARHCAVFCFCARAHILAQGGGGAATLVPFPFPLWLLETNTSIAIRVFSFVSHLICPFTTSLSFCLVCFFLTIS